MLLNDGVRNHPKILKAGGEAAWFWASAIDYSRDQLTDGYVPLEALAKLGTFKTSVARLASTCVAAGLFEEADGGYRVHDFLKHNHSKADVENKRAAGKARKAEYRAKMKGGLDASVSPVSVVPVPECPSETVTPGQDVDVDVDEIFRENVVPLGQRSHHRSHAFCGRICVPAFLHDELRRKMPGSDPDAADRVLRQWYLKTDVAWQGKPIGDSDLEFWRARFVDEHGTTKAPAKPARHAIDLSRLGSRVKAMPPS